MNFFRGVIGFLDGKRAILKENRRESERNRLILSESAFMIRQQELGLDFVRHTLPVARKLAQQLENEFLSSYQTNVYNRMVIESNYCEETIHELMFEQKRFLLMASVLKNVPMFSKDVDEVWHQMLMFTREYKEFTEVFAGQFIHHSPNVGGEDGIDDKFTFDMMYKELFVEMSFSSKCWGSKFYELKPSSLLTNEWGSNQINTLENKYFFNTKQARPISSELTHRIVTAVRESGEIDRVQQFKYNRDAIKGNTRYNNDSHFSDYQNSLLTLPYIFWLISDDPSEYSSSLGHTVSTGDSHSNSGSSKDSDSSSCGSSSGGSSCGSSPGGSSGGSSCGSSCGSGCGSS